MAIITGFKLTECINIDNNNNNNNNNVSNKIEILFTNDLETGETEMEIYYIDFIITYCMLWVTN